MRQLYVIASRRLDDPCEGLEFQLKDGLKTMVQHWCMSAGLVCSVDDTHLRVIHHYTERPRIMPDEQASLVAAHTTVLRPTAGRGSALAAQHIDLLPLIVKSRETPLSELDEELRNFWVNVPTHDIHDVVRAPRPEQTDRYPSDALQESSGWSQIRDQVYRAVVIPLTFDGKRFGNLTFFATHPNSVPFGEAEQQDLQLFADWVSSVLERSQMRLERTQDQTDLARINREIVRSNSDLDHFVYIASHDLKEPLRGISQYAQFLTEDYSTQLDDEGQRMLQALVDQSQRMGKQIDDLRFYSRIGRHDSGIELVDINDIVADVRARLRTLFDETNVGIRIPRSLPTVKGNVALITTVFQNLMANAARYNDKEHKWIQITWGYQAQGTKVTDLHGDTDTNAEVARDDVAAVIRTLQDGQGKTVITIADNGIGIYERDREAIFTMFRRLHNQDAYGGGTGAGLAIVKRILEEAGGTIWFDSEIGVGTQFHFTFE